MSNSSLLMIGLIQCPYGIQGGVRVKSYAQSLEDFKSYQIFQTESGHQLFHLTRLQIYKNDTFNVHFREINTRTQAETWRDTPLYIRKDQLKSLEAEEYYHHDLIGLNVQDEQEKLWGVVKNILEGGGGLLLVITLTLENARTEIMIPFHREFVLNVDILNQKMTLNTAYLENMLALETS